MGDDLGRLLNIALMVVSVATLGGFGYVRGRIGDLNGQLDEARKEIADQERRLTGAVSERDQLRTDLDALARVVTGEAHWIAIGARLDEHHAEAVQHWTRDEQILEQIRDLLPRLPGGS